MTDPVAVVVDAEVASIARLGWFLAAGLRVIERAAVLDEPLRAAAAAARLTDARANVTAAVRTMYKRLGLDPTRTRPSSEALLRRVRRGDDLPRINNVVDVVNWCSLESQLPFGLYDADRIEGHVTVRRGQAEEQYAGIRKDVVHVAGRLVLADGQGPFGNPSSDSARTMVTTATTSALVVIFAPAGLPAASLVAAVIATQERIARYCR